MSNNLQNRPYTLKEISARMSMSDKGAKTWIKENIPGIYKKGVRRKNIFSPQEAARIIAEYEI